MNDFSERFPDNRLTGETTLRQAQLVMLRMLRIIDYICRKHRIPYWFCSGTLLGAVRNKGFIPWDDDLDIAMMRDDYERFLKVAQEELPDDLFLQTRETESTYDSLSVPCKLRDTQSLFQQDFERNKAYHQGIFIDIFPFDKYHKTGVKRRIERGLKKLNKFLCSCYDAEIGKHEHFYKRVLAYFRPVFYYLISGYLKLIRPIIRKNASLADDACELGHGFDLPWLQFFPPSDIFPVREVEFEGYSFLVPHNSDHYLRTIFGDDYMTPPPVEKRYQRHSEIIKPYIK
ncbi:phosphorylcholine transferase LicD [Bacteroidia bacterium]|nr:phosphorylcholine transferase LicD [Bacteroidia bacterium]